MDYLNTIVDKARNAWRSKTIWFNGLLLTILPLIDAINVAMPQLQAFLPDNWYKTVGLIALVGNILLRFATSRPLEEK